MARNKIVSLFICSVMFLAGCAPAITFPPSTFIPTPMTPTSTSEPIATATIPPTSTPQPMPVGDLNGAISFVQQFSAGGPQLQIVDPNGVDIKVLAKKFGTILYYVWSPNEQYIAFLSQRKLYGKQELFVLDLHTSISERIGSEDLNIVSFAWSPDNRTLTFSTVTGEGKNSTAFLYTVSIDDPTTTHKVLLEIETHSIGSLAWSADGKKISFTSPDYYESNSEAWKPDWYVVAPDGTQFQQVGSTSGQDSAVDKTKFVWNVAWAPSGSRIAMASIYAITALDLDTNETQTLTRNPNGNFAIVNLSWSPDGKQIAYNMIQLSSASYPFTSIHVYSLDKKTDRELVAARGESIDSFAWSPDSSQLAFTQCSDICTIYRADIKTDKTTVVRADLLPGITSLTLKWVAPVNVAQSVVPATPTPISPWAALSTPPIYDSFQASSLDPGLWKTPTSDYFTYTVNQGQLKINTKGSAENQDYSLQLGDARVMRESVVLDAKIKINSGDFVSGGWGVAKTAIWLNSRSMKWATQCRLGNNLLKPTFVCDTANVEKGYVVTYQTKSIPVNFNRWYDVRIEIRRSDGAVQYYLDDTLLDTYLSDYARQLTYHVTNLTAYIGEYTSYGWISAFFKDVRISN